MFAYYKLVSKHVKHSFNRFHDDKTLQRYFPTPQREEGLKCLTGNGLDTIFFNENGRKNKILS
jgi:hypothetical protein